MLLAVSERVVNETTEVDDSARRGWAHGCRCGAFWLHLEPPLSRRHRVHLRTCHGAGGIDAGEFRGEQPGRFDLGQRFGECPCKQLPAVVPFK